ncbi:MULTISPECIES: hypothetical protein [unclassified Variovorax]|uniref:hypothetical protein n=1 Tax=unclassified Variovorax TaxID=663243 RepID=UPI00076CEDAC|nr:MULTISPECIES: hypothetical protein [unclassified Variovorax]KWT83872.1 hypothetical protein APY03_4427 [Variovorax sp. WDL1]PNG46551.1 hypothetical protein CHC06_06894 [Variovorax sp. B2]PNG47627.1 hypothetical protein CHC07_06793 [Variovorax sp. B4]VTV14316.1 hypothetical protein WDL1CHR_04867 [Variovorax sp. WDL1]
MVGAAGGLMIVWVLIALLIAVLWILMPFAIFGSKPLLRTLIEEQKRTNRLLEELAEATKPPTRSLVSGTVRSEGGSLVSEKYREN